MDKNSFQQLTYLPPVSPTYNIIILLSLKKILWRKFYGISIFQANHYYICCRGLVGWEVRLCQACIQEVGNYPSTIKYPQAILLHQLRATQTIIECRQGCAQESTCITGGSYFFLLPSSPPPPSPTIIILLLLGHSCCRYSLVPSLGTRLL